MENNTNNGMHWCSGRRAWRILWVVIIAVIVGSAVASGFGWRGHKNDQQDTIVISGTGKVVVKPDMATVSFSVMQENMDVSKASDAVNTKIAAITKALAADGVADADITTTDYSVYPRYNYVNTTVPNGSMMPIPVGGTQVLAGYDVTQSIEVKIRDLSKAGNVVTDLTGLGVTNMSGLNFTEDKYDDLVKQARDQAIADARSQADSLAKSLGVRLDKIVGYSD
ncbi:SIMPL domain-containing protein, partial [Patescibacteria group bacterium]|nr:SIMPL domain-containing protein [Patescibacteria group bacterium]